MLIFLLSFLQCVCYRFVRVSTVLVETRRGHQILWRHGCRDPPKLQEQQVQGSRGLNPVWKPGPQSAESSPQGAISLVVSLFLQLIEALVLVFRLVFVSLFEKTSPAARAGLTLSIQVYNCWGEGVLSISSS